MKYSTKTGSLPDLKTPVLVCSAKIARKAVPVRKGAEIVDAALRDFKDKPGNTITLAMPKRCNADRLIVVGGGDDPVSASNYRKMVRSAATAAARLEVSNVLWALTAVGVEDHDPYWRASAGITELSLSLYEFNQHKSNKSNRRMPNVQVHTDARSRTNVARAVREGNALKEGLDFARNLGNQPPNVCDPNYLLREARKLGRQDKVSVSALNERRMEELGMGAFLSVTRGSERPGRMIIVNYKGGKRADAPVVLIGKGITFDSGGISLKPGAGMDEMKFDMCGAAAVLGTAKAVIAAKLPINLIVMVAAAENMPSGRASHPGDIVTSLSGKTVEILNTDAEGRLVLCDAISYASRYKPKVVIDVATLTGACIIALGSHASAVYANDDTLARDLIDAGEWSGDRAWHMPLWNEYQVQLSSRFADVSNIGGREAGSITAACFLSRFAEGFKWAHMDIAGTGFRGGMRKGATGRPVALLYRYLLTDD
ncbi:MAG: leucyl aminopeptidase [Pseudomonadales bacterium]|jgi:leucyl aminopeptidase|nr:leucyl aminopeptidase [Pseudomonadales bacterium]MDP6471617.1 leucyl aminopeptidase [Pseudomonadales bacterium]MDP6828880.1 leucyl aminopeptidase [Pseudomonadales bacterium]MDP6972808.1 leucyl aminopeptidase [Pseudomonadales bacterium]